MCHYTDRIIVATVNNSHALCESSAVQPTGKLLGLVLTTFVAVENHCTIGTLHAVCTIACFKYDIDFHVIPGAPAHNFTAKKVDNCK
jgi:hypothetical protein